MKNSKINPEKKEETVLSHFVVNTRPQFNFSSSRRLNWMLMLLVLFSLLKGVDTQLEAQELVEAEIDVVPPYSPLVAQSFLSNSAAFLPAWQGLFDDKNKDLLKGFKPRFYSNFRVVGSHLAVAKVIAQIEKTFKLFNSEPILKELALLKKGMPELRIVASSDVTPSQSGETGGRYSNSRKEIELPVPNSAEEESFGMSKIIHELSHTFSNFAFELLQLEDGKTQDKYDNYYHPSQKQLKALWQQGDKTVDGIRANFNEFYRLSQLTVKDEKTQKRTKQLKQSLDKFRTIAKDLVDRSNLYDVIQEKIFYTTKKSARSAELKIGDVINLGPNTKTDSGLETFGELRILKIATTSDGRFHFTLTPQDPVVAFIRIHQTILNNVATDKKQRYSEERIAYSRQLPDAIVKFVWKDIYQYQEELRQKVEEKLNQTNSSNIQMNDVQRHNRMAKKFKFYISNMENGLKSGRLKKNKKNTYKLSFYYHQYINALINANKLVKAKTMLDTQVKNGLFSQVDSVLMGKIHFLNKNYPTAIGYFAQTEGETLSTDNGIAPIEIIMRDYYYGVSLLEVGDSAAALRKLTVAHQAMRNNHLIEAPLLALCEHQIAVANRLVSSMPRPSFM